MARLQRLIFIADCCPTLSLEALKLAMAYVVETFNTALFLQLRQRLKNAMVRRIIWLSLVFGEIRSWIAVKLGSSSIPFS